MTTSYISQDGYDLCVICKEKTPYTVETHIDARTGYIVGVGQVCLQCLRRTND